MSTRTERRPALRGPAPGRRPVLRRVTFGVGTAYLVALALIAFWPVPVDRAGYGTLLAAIDWLQEHGAPGLRYDTVEFTANIALFVPVGLVAVILAGARRWWWGILIGFAASAGIELAQLAFLPARFATVSDVIANTSGAMAGVALGVVVLARAAGRGPTAE